MTRNVCGKAPIFASCAHYDRAGRNDVLKLGSPIYPVPCLSCGAALRKTDDPKVQRPTSAAFYATMKSGPQ